MTLFLKHAIQICILSIFMLSLSDAIWVQHEKSINPQKSVQQVPFEHYNPISTNTTASSTPTKAKTASTTAKKLEVQPKEAVEAPQVPVSTPVAAPTVQTPIATAPQQPSISLETLNTSVRDAVVNIYCIPPQGDLSAITGTGVIIDSRGVILTNAHVGQYFLLDIYHDTPFVNCVIRTGSPASAAYKAKLLYISGAWMNIHAKDITIEHPMETGENDFALLYITSQATPGTSLPARFTALSPQIDLKQVLLNNQMLVAAYPAGFLGAVTIINNLWLTSTLSHVSNVFSFSSDQSSVDLLGLEGSILAQQGSSGGAVVDTSNGLLAGIVVTSAISGSTDTREMRAITLSHINTSLQNQTGHSLAQFLSGDLEYKLESWQQNTAPTLQALLFEQIVR